MKPRLSGIFAALLTPRDASGKVDYELHDTLVDFVLARGVDGVVIGGGTAEYPHLELADRKELISRTVRSFQGRGLVLASIGTSSIQTTLRLGEHAVIAGCTALLLPMPYFFRYEQHDLKAFCEVVCRTLPAPILLYNLPSFTNPLAVETAIELLEAEQNLVGIKDSSEDRGSLMKLAEARSRGDFSLLIGDDSVLLDALTAGWDGVVSGIVCFVPELVGVLYRNFRTGNHQMALASQALLHDLIPNLLRLPIPWGIRVGLAARGLSAGEFALPLSDLRKQQVAAFHAWLPAWFSRAPEGLAWIALGAGRVF
jgi:4-hydroxy-tetrahydrodipicolinate synthase